MAQIGEIDTQSVFYVFVFFLTHLFSITHLPFQATINMSSGSGAEDCRAGLPPEDESNASRFCRDAESAAVVAAPGAELGRGDMQISSAAADGFGARAILQTSAAGSTPAPLAENPQECNEYPDKGATAASAKVRHSLTLLVLFYLSCFSNCNTLNLFYSFTFTAASQFSFFETKEETY